MSKKKATTTTLTPTGPKGAAWEQWDRFICEALTGEPYAPRSPEDRARDLAWITANCPHLLGGK